MREILFIILCTMSLNLFGAEPQIVAKKFVENFAKGNLTEAKKYADANSSIVLSFVDTRMLSKYPNYKFEALRDSIEGDSIAYVYYLTPDKKEDKLRLVKENNEWKVSLGK